MQLLLVYFKFPYVINLCNFKFPYIRREVLKRSKA